MKICPACQTQYSDDTLQFCLQDGTPLVGPSDVETPTVVLGETETVLARGGDRMQVPISDPGSAAWPQSQVTHVATLQPKKKGSYTAVALAATAIGMLFLFGIVGVGAWLFLRNSQQPTAQNTANTANMPGSAINSNTFSTPLPYPTTTRPLTPSTPTPTPPASSATAPPPVLSSYPSTTRLKFARGSYSTSFGGDLNPGDSRSLVLSCRNGQSLSANVSSENGCVTLRGGGTSLRTTTSGGDNYLVLTNSCPSMVHFSISVTIL